MFNLLFFLALCSSLCGLEFRFPPIKKEQPPQVPEKPCAPLMEAPCEKKGDLFADLLYWHMGEVRTLPNVTLAVTGDQTLTSKLRLNNFDFGWDFGFRAGGKYSNLGQDCWGLSLYYTWYRTEAKERGFYPGFVGFPSGFPLTGTLSDVNFLDLAFLFAAKRYKAQWSLLYNIFDFEADREYEVGSSLFLRPYVGLRGGWIDQDIHIHSIYVNNAGISVPAIEKLQHHFWGIGPKAGLSSKWCLGNVQKHSFYLFGDLSGSFLWSHWMNSDFLTINDVNHGDLTGKNRFAGSAVLQDLLGLEWNIALNCKDMLFSLRCSFESQFWFDHLQIFNSFSGRQHNALTLQGGTVDFRFYF